MKARLLGALRDMWWLLALFLAACVGFGFVVGPVLAGIVWLVIAGTFVYFAWVRYDDTGHERPDLD
ncbi:MAG: hypothetical protein D6693_00800 [Planctomycetota bacterium]|nr:MAG: hypothetical protein D6693_00800 [Planctomycetota bacterium]